MSTNGLFLSNNETTTDVDEYDIESITNGDNSNQESDGDILVSDPD